MSRPNESVAPHSQWVGIEVSKARLDVAVRPSGACWQSANDEAGIAALVAQLQGLQPAPQLVVLEATGGLERAVTAALALGGLPVVVVNPRQARQVRDFAKATGQLAKTDALDAAGDRPTSPMPCAPRPARCRMPRPSCWRPWWSAGTNWWGC